MKSLLLLVCLSLVAIETTSQQATSSNKQYQQARFLSSSASLPQQLVISHINQRAPEVELDNVIESTTSTLQQQRPQRCQLPPQWAGKWYQANKEPIRVTMGEISDKGQCRDQKGDKFLFEMKRDKLAPACLVCLVINERHLNVLQYKESTCQPLPADTAHLQNNTADQDHSLLDSICSDITGDAQLESLFRLETPAIECPIGGQFTFAYDACREPLSSLDSCIDKKQLNFKFSACPDVPGSESKIEHLKCYADWSEGNNYYMIGRLENTSNYQDMGKFRCFLYEKSVDGKIIQMAQSLEESCYGLINANEGPKTMRIIARSPSQHKCQFPHHIQSLSENWLSVDNSLIYWFNQNSTKYTVKETKEGNVIEEATCLQQFSAPSFQQQQVASHLHPQQQQQQARSSSSSSNHQAGSRRQLTVMSTSGTTFHNDQQSTKSATSDLVYLVQITKNCHIANYCVRFYKRSNGIVQIDYFDSISSGDNPCIKAFLPGTQPQTQIITSTSLEYQRCPFEGAYTIEASIESDITYNPSNIFICPRQSLITAACDHPSRLKILSRCSPGKAFTKSKHHTTLMALHCLGSWTTNGWVRLLLADDDRQRYSAWYYSFLGGALISLNDQAQVQQARTRSKQLLAASSLTLDPSNPTPIPLQPTVELNLALITLPGQHTRTMRVRLSRRQQCADIRSYTNLPPGSYGSPSPVVSVQTTNPSSSAATLNCHHFCSSILATALLLIIVDTLLIPFMIHP